MATYTPGGTVVHNGWTVDTTTNGGYKPGTISTNTPDSHEQFVRRMYRDIFGREADAAGLAFWTNSLRSGVHTQGSVYNAFIRTPEGVGKLRERVRQQYRDIFGREPESDAVVDDWVTRIQNGELGVTSSEIGAAFRQTPEYVNGPNGSGSPVDEPGGTTEEGESELGGGGGVEAPPEVVDISAQVEMVLKRYGLESLAPKMKQLIQSGALTNDKAILWLYDQDEFKARFPALEMQRGNGFAVMTPEEYLQYERQAAQMMRMAGFPPGFYDQPSDFTNLIGNDISIAELNAHVVQAFSRVTTAAPEVRARMAQFFGVQGDQALAAYVLDFDKAAEVLMQEISAAEIAGVGDIMGTGIGQATAEQLAAMGYNGQNAMGNFQNIAGQQSLFQESISESADLTAENEGVGAAFGIDPDSAETLENRRAGRIGALSGGGGQIMTQEGIGGRADS